MTRWLPLFVMVFCCMAAHAQSIVMRDDADTLRNWMSGTFALQNPTDASQPSVALHVIPIWLHGIDGAWLYAEETAATIPNKPYRQRVYHLFRLNDSTVVERVYELKSPQRSAGAWQHDKPLDDLRTDSLALQNGCDVMLHKSGNGYYYGGTQKNSCASQNGAAYNTIDVTIYPNKFTRWERGWDVNGKQISSPPNEGHVFTKQQ